MDTRSESVPIWADNSELTAAARDRPGGGVKIQPRWQLAGTLPGEEGVAAIVHGDVGDREIGAEINRGAPQLEERRLLDGSRQLERIVSFARYRILAAAEEGRNE